MTPPDSHRTYAHDAHCNVVHTPGPEPCPPACGHDWQASEFGTFRACGKCASVVEMRAGGLTFSGWTGEP